MGPQIDEIARLLADRSRATMLGALMDGRQWTATELARAANVTASTASLHLQRLVEGDLVCSAPSGRHKYYRIARPEVARALEGLMVLAPPPAVRHATRIDDALRTLRTCYDHLAGKIAVDLTTALATSGAVRFDDAGATFTSDGEAEFARLGIVVPERSGRRPLCRACLDWSERRYHLAGRIGVALANHALAREWVRRVSGSRALHVTALGAAAFAEQFRVFCSASASQDF